MSIPYLSIIIPAYNESKRIVPTVRDITETLKHVNYYYEIIAVNDGSKDDTFAVLQKMQEEITQLKVINNIQNRGRGYAVKCGMEAAKADFRIFMDADNSVKISEIYNFLPKINEGYDLVIGSIAIGELNITEKNGYWRRPLGIFSKYITRMFATPGIYDTQRGFKLFTKHAAEIIFPKITIERFGFDIELVVIAQENNLKIKELPVTFDNPEGSSVRLTSYITTFFELLKIIIKKKRGEYKVK